MYIQLKFVIKAKLYKAKCSVINKAVNYLILSFIALIKVKMTYLSVFIKIYNVGQASNKDG